MFETTVKKAEELTEARKLELSGIEEQATKFSLADAIREGSKNTIEVVGYGDGESACALHSAVISALSRDLVQG